MSHQNHGTGGGGGASQSRTSMIVAGVAGGLLGCCFLLLVGAWWARGSGFDGFFDVLPGRVDTTLFEAGSSAGPVQREIPAEGGRVDGPGGLEVEAMAGTFPAGTTVTMSEAETPPLPAGATAYGRTFSITSEAAPEIPVTVSLPIPEGSPAENIYLLRTDVEGNHQIIGGAVEGDRYVAAVPGFSMISFIAYEFEEALTGNYDNLLDRIIQESAGENMPPPELRGEYATLVTGERDEAAARTVKIVGPSEIAASDGFGSYGAIDFVAYRSRFLSYEWNVYGEGVSAQGPLDGARLLLEGHSEGRITITVDVTDPRLGASAFASKRVFVTGEDALALTLFADKSEYFSRDAGPLVTARAEGGTAPYTYSWESGAGISGSTEPRNLSVDIEHPPLTDDTILTVVVTDADGFEASASIGMKANGGSEDEPRYLLVGPFAVDVGEEATFEILTSGEEADLSGLELARYPRGPLERSGNTFTTVFTEPGIGRILLREGNRLDPVGFLALRVEGEAPALQTRFVEAPEQVAVGQEVEFVVEIQGGLVLDVDYEPYALNVRLGDDAVIEREVTGETAAEWTEARVSHTYDEPGTYQVTVTGRSADGQESEATHQIEVIDRIRAEGTFNRESFDNFTVLENRIVLVIDGERVEIPTWEYRSETTYTGFVIEGGAEQEFEADCLSTTIWTLQESDLTYDPETGQIEGEIRMRDERRDVGSECPFGGANRDLVRTTNATGRLEDGVFILDMDFPATENAPQIILSATAEVR